MSPRVALPLALLCLAAPLTALAAKDPIKVEQGAPPPAQGATVYVEKDGAPLREGPSGEAKVVKKLPLGVPVTVQAEAPVAGTLAGEQGHWVRVYNNAEGAGYGWMWSGTLTFARFKQDLDGDGEAEVVTVGFNKDDEVVVRVREPKATDPEEASAAVNLGLRSDIDGTLTAVEVSLLPAGEAGLPLVQVMWIGREMCASSSWYSYASYSEAGAPKAKIALAHVGSGADAPIYWETTARFSAADKAVELTELNGEGGGDAAPTEQKKTTRYVLEDGVFVDPTGAPTEWSKPPPRAEGREAGGAKGGKAKAKAGPTDEAADAAKAAAKKKALEAAKGKAGGKGGDK
ncbi:MAG: SH3 domain-containing protein [Deltaproteobacteria bacterium]|nr:SH3 domain-containing protein [Deltaproteobacteria bacterium]